MAFQANPIKFGTDGWRGVIAADFTFERVTRLAPLAAMVLGAEFGEGKWDRPVIVGYDRRFLAEEFARAAAEALQEAGYFNDKARLRRCGLVLGNLSFPTSSSHRQLAEVYTQTMENALRELLQDDQFTLPATQKEKPDNAILEWTVSRMARSTCLTRP